MSAWKLVPVEPTEGMLLDGDEVSKWTASEVIYRAMLSASPDPTTDEALVERVARAICDAAWGHGSFDRPTEQGGFSSEAKEQARGQALAAIRAMEEKP